MPSSARSVRRSRWAAIGAAVAVSVGAGGVLTSWAGTSPTLPTVFVPMTPCRLLDTRPAPDNVGARDTALGPTEVFATAGRGTVGNCTIPAEATALSMNVAVINPTAASFLTVYPADATRPVSANLNWVARQAPTPNAVTAGLSADGRLALFNLAGTVDVAIDVVGYYAPAKQALTDVSSDVVDLGRTIETVAGQIGALQTAVSTLATPQEVIATPVSVPSNVTAQVWTQTGSVTTTTAGRWWISATYGISVTCSVGTNYVAFLLVDGAIVPSTMVTFNGTPSMDRVTFAGPTPTSLSAGSHTVRVGAWCYSGVASTLTGVPNTSSINVMVLR
jgi:hypothetical protein